MRIKPGFLFLMASLSIGTISALPMDDIARLAMRESIDIDVLGTDVNTAHRARGAYRRSRARSTSGHTEMEYLDSRVKKGKNKSSKPSASTKHKTQKGPKKTHKPSGSSLSRPSPSRSSSSASVPSKLPPSSGSKLSGELDQLFPVKGFSESWTTCPSDGALSLSDSTFRPTKVMKSVPHTYTSAPDGKRAIKAHYAKGSYNFGHKPQGGFSFYAPGPANVDLTTAKEATLGYSVFFPDGFEFQKGGKLPGIYGGNSDNEAISCSGGRRSTACFSARLMWRAKGAGEFYTYLPPSFRENKKLCNVKPFSECNPTYGASVGRGAFTFATGRWTTVAERIRLNDIGQANGELELFADGKSVVKVDGLVLRDKDEGRMRGIQMQTFFGGSKSDFATPKDQDVFFSDFSVAIIQKI